MKFTCSCGATLHDQSDALPHRGHLIADQDWHPVADALDDAVIDALAAGTIDREAAYHRARLILGRASRSMYQCRACGRLYIDDRQGRLQCYVPAGPETSKEILRSRESAAGGDPDRAASARN
jgi:hypothetical protein